MKKTLIAAAAAVALTVSAAAEITFGAWLRVLTAPVASNGDDTVCGMTNSWGWGARSARLDINAVAEDGNAGMSMHVFNDAKGGIAGDEAQMWVKPLEQVKVSVGRFDNSALRGDFCYGSWNWIRPENVVGEEFFMSGNGTTGLMAEITPVEGLYIQASVPFVVAGSSDTDATPPKYETFAKAEDTYKNARAGFAYTIDGVGKIKAQYLGKGDDKTIEGEFDLTSVENLFVGAGVTANIYDATPAANAKTTSIAAGVSYQVNEAMKVSASFAYQMYEKNDADMNIGAGIDYNLGDGLAFSADVRATIFGASNKDPVVSFLAGITKNVSSNGLIGIGFQGGTNGCDFGNCAIKNDTDKLSWCVPVTISTWF